MVSVDRAKSILLSNDYEVGKDDVKDLLNFLYRIATLQVEIENNEIKQIYNEEDKRHFKRYSVLPSQ